MTPAPARFTFDVDMGQKTKHTHVLAEERLNELVEEARKEGYKDGFIAGETSEQSRTSQALLAATTKLGNNCAELIAARDEIQKKSLENAVKLGSAVGRKLANNLIARQPEIELEALISECLSSLDEAAHLVIRCHPDLAQTCKDTAEKQMNTSRFSGRLVVMGDPEIKLGDGKIEWMDGGLVRDRENILSQMEISIENYLGANGIVTSQTENTEQSENETTGLTKLEPETK